MSNTRINKKRTTKDKGNIKKYKTTNTIISVLLLVVIVIAMCLFSNKTFLKSKYIGDGIELHIPMFTYFVSDKDNKIIFKTIKKQYYVQEYFDEYLSNLDNFDYYNCKNGKTFYYDETNQFAIKKLDIKKGLLLKTIVIEYEKNNVEELCL